MAKAATGISSRSIGTFVALLTCGKCLRRLRLCGRPQYDFRGVKQSKKRRSIHMAVTKAKVRPLNDKVLIKRLEAESKTAGGIVLPETAKEKPKRGRVVAIGDGKLLDTGERGNMQVKANDEVLF